MVSAIYADVETEILMQDDRFARLEKNGNQIRKIILLNHDVL
jgi:hypothetical protein